MGKARGSIPISAMTLRVPCHRVGNNRFARNLLPMVHSATVPSTILGRLTGPHGAVVHCALTPCGGAATPRRACGKRYGEVWPPAGDAGRLRGGRSRANAL